MAWITKSRFTAGLQCSKRLWFEVNQPLTEPQADAVSLMQGRSFDQIVQTLWPGKVISRERGMPAAIAETKAVLRAGGADILYQPAFRSGDLAVIADVLRRRGPTYELVEVKASTKVKDQHIPDVAFQTLVLRATGLPVSSVRVGYVNNAFVLRETGRYDGLEVEKDVTNEVEASLQRIADTASEQLELIKMHEAPDVEMGPQCHSPYDCPFIARCTAARASIPDYPVELLPRGGKLIESLKAQGFDDLRSVPPDRLTSETHLRVHAATLSGTPYFDADATRELRGLERPYSYLDFETVSFSVPQLIGTRPYEQWPFQWSVHVEDAAGAIQHAEYLDVDGFGDFDRLAAALLAAIPGTGPVFAYNASFERRVLEGLAGRLPKHAAALEALSERLFDLLPVTQSAYYHRDMQGSWSIKAVLPTIDPSLSYSDLEDIQAGDAAQLAFFELRSPGITAARRERLTQSLRDYCKRDTWGMVVLRRFLAQEQR